MEEPKIITIGDVIDSTLMHLLFIYLYVDSFTKTLLGMENNIHNYCRIPRKVVLGMLDLC